MYKRLRSPFNVQLEVTGSCPHRCQHCYNFWREKDESLPSLYSGALTPVQVATLVQKLADASVFSLVITGGEPLLNMPASLACLEAAHARGMTVNMNSSLTLLTEERAQALKAAGLKHVLTSILGPTPEIHDAITQTPGSFERLLTGLKQARDFGLAVSANMVVSQLNIDSVRATAELLLGFGIKTFCATKAGCPGNCTDFSSLQLSNRQVTAFLNDLCWCHSHLGMAVDTLEPVPFCGLLGVEQPTLFSSRRCSAGVTAMTISYDGSVRPCSHLDVEYGNLLREDLATVWGRMDSWSKGEHVPKDCSACSLLSLCGSGCRMEAKSGTGRLDSLDPYSELGNVSAIAPLLCRPQSTKTIQAFETIRFKPTTYRTRPEDFGGVVSVSSRNRVLLDHRGFAVVLQLKHGRTYESGDPSIDWRGLNPHRFVANLQARGVVLLD